MSSLTFVNPLLQGFRGNGWSLRSDRRWKLPANLLLRGSEAAFERGDGLLRDGPPVGGGGGLETAVQLDGKVADEKIGHEGTIAIC